MAAFLQSWRSTLLLFVGVSWSGSGGVAAAATGFGVEDSSLWSWNETEWSLTTTTPTFGEYQGWISAANGYVGAAMSAIGPFYETATNHTNSSGTIPQNGWPLFDSRITFSTVSGFFDVQSGNGTGTNFPELNNNGWESFISGIPHPTGLLFSFEGSTLDGRVSNTTLSNFSTKLSFKTGVQEWKYTWTPANSTSYEVSYAAIASRQRPNVIAVKASIAPSSDSSGTITDILDGSSAVRAYLHEKGSDETTIFSAVHPSGLADKTAYIISGVNFSNPYTNLSTRSEFFSSTNVSTIGQAYNINLKSGQTAEFYKFVGVASNDKFTDPEAAARDAQSSAQEVGWHTLLAEHTEAWGKIMTKDAIDDFTDPVTGEIPDNEQLQILHISGIANTYYLLQNLMPDGSGLNDNSIAVGGLTSDSYAGLTFWDADYWMAPILNLAFPTWAKQIPNLRIKQHAQAMANAVFNGYSNGSSLYSWTAGRYGNCTGTGPCADYEYHLNYDICFNLLQLQNVTKNSTWFNDMGPRDILETTAQMTGELLSYNETTKTWWLRNMTDPDEYANHVDNGAFTIASAAKLVKYVNAMRGAQNLPINATWEDQWTSIEFPQSPTSNITLEYTGMNTSINVKQADVVLLTYPLDYGQNYSADDKLLDLDYYANKQSADGPAMTYSIFAIGANSLSPSGSSAYTYALAGTIPYLRAPWFQFSEQNDDNVFTNGFQNPAFPFLTGHGGAAQVPVFGFGGVRTDQPLLYFNPSLPPQIPYLKLRNIYYGGATLSAFLNSTHMVLSRLPTSSDSGHIDTFGNTPVPVTIGTPIPNSSTSTTYAIFVNQTIAIPNRLYWQELTDADNILQNLPVISQDDYVPGQFSVAAVDGATATRWQPTTNESSSLLVNRTGFPAVNITQIYFDFGPRPPKSAVISFGNMTDGNIIYGNEFIVNITNITPSLPYNATDAVVNSQNVNPIFGNTTTFAVAGDAWSGDFIRLEIEGCWIEDGVGATVGEFVVRGYNASNAV